MSSTSSLEPAPGAAEQALAAERAAIDAALGRFCARYLDAAPGAVSEAIRYSLLGGGKRLRGILVVEAYRACGGRGDASELAGAVEVVHAYSLVHDDLPCMDDDSMRRGRPTVHRVHGVPAATAAGVAMVPLAVRCALHAARALELPGGVAAAIVQELMTAAGAGGMIGGQLLDLEGEGLALTLAELERIHRMKTGALITASVRIGGLAGGADERRLDALARYGAAIGLAFQIADDVLDVTATTDVLGKTAGKDLAFRKSTYPALLGVQGATDRAAALVAEAREALDAVGLLTPTLDRLARYTIARKS
jgi:farnesyl diphosphate synthase/geranylgeranyl diphosphate synthase type II